MDNDKIWTNITRKLAGEDSAEDAGQLNDWIGEKQANEQIYNTIKEVWEYRNPITNQHLSLFESIKRRIAVFELQPKPSRIFTSWFRAAAIIMVLLVSNFMVYYLTRPTQPEATLISWQEIVVPRGNRMKLILPDSTSVWLNNETRFKYASNYGTGNRQVELSGEAYFDVKHDKKHPFVVHVGDQHIRVLGTRFSVNAYPDDRIIETSLISGSVIFGSNSKIGVKTEHSLEPGYSLYYDKVNNSISRSKIQSSYYSYWENGVYSFKDESLESLSVKIKRIFNVELVFGDEFLKQKTYTGTISINDNIFNFMEAIRRTSVEPIEYKFNKNIIYVKLKK